MKRAARIIGILLCSLCFMLVTQNCHSSDSFIAAQTKPTDSQRPPKPTSESVLFADTFENYVTWKEGSTHGNWFVNFNGGGDVGIESDTTLPGGSKMVHFQKPKASTVADETHASLVTSIQAMGDFNLFIKMKTLQQLRTPTPNPWETAWVVWHYTDNDHFYYFTLKTNGWEIGKRDPAYTGGQKFLKTGSTPKVIVGSFADVNIKQTGATITIVVNGSELATFADTERPYFTGKLGLYNEDAYVHFDNVKATY